MEELVETGALAKIIQTIVLASADLQSEILQERYRVRVSLVHGQLVPRFGSVYHKQVLKVITILSRITVTIGQDLLLISAV